MSRFGGVIALLLLGVACQFAVLGSTKAPLSKAYREFLNGPPSLLLTKDERTAFQRLGSDPERDSFIEHFWQVRNPTPGLVNNEFKEEFLPARRIRERLLRQGCRDAGLAHGPRLDLHLVWEA